MQEKKNIRLLLSLVILLVTTALVVWLKADDGAVEVNKTLFRVEDFKTVDAFTFESKAGKIELKYNGSRWKINEQYDADRNLVDVLFATLQQAKPKRPVASSLEDSIGQVLIHEGVKVSLFSRGTTLKSFYAGGNKQKTQAYFKEDKKEPPYIMVIPGYRVYASGIFELDESGWRDKRIFNFNWRNFTAMTATFAGVPNQNFKAAFINKYFGIEGMERVDTTKLNNYLDAVSLLSASQIIKPGFSTVYDSLAKTQPLVTLAVKDVADRNYNLDLYPPMKNDPMVMGRIATGEVVLFDRQAIMLVVKGRDYFLRKP